MDRILFFQIAKGEKGNPTYRIHIFREQAGEFILYYFQLCGDVTLADPVSVQGEMYKGYERVGSRFLKKEEQMHTYMAYDESFFRWLTMADAMDDWQRKWNLPIYCDYYSVENIKWLLAQIPTRDCPKNAFVLGSGMGMREWLPSLAERVQGITFYCEFATKGLEELQELLLEEYGMLTEVHLVAGGEFKKIRLYSEEPILVIDFTGKSPMLVSGLKKGSVWVDMDAVEEKRRLVEDRRTGVKYLSLKKLWKREMLQTLDIISKFAYNTEVKIGRF